MSRGSRLVNNTAIYAIGSIGSKLASLLLLPLYAYSLSPSAFGFADIVGATIAMVLPVVSLSVYDAVFRFAIDAEVDRVSVLSTAMALTIGGGAVASTIGVLCTAMGLAPPLLTASVVGIATLQAAQAALAQFSRAIGRTRLFAADGILSAVMVVVASWVALIVMDLGIWGYLLGVAAGTVWSIMFLSGFGGLWRYIQVSRVRVGLFRPMLAFSAPLMANALMWWIMNSSSKYVVFATLGAGAAGVFAVASRLPAVLSVFNSVFFQAWQVSAIEEYGSATRSEYYSRAFDIFARLNFVGISMLLVVIRPAISAFLPPEYFAAWAAIPLLLLSLAFVNFATFLGTNYVAAKSTGGVFWTTILGGAVNLGLSLALVPQWGLLGAGASRVCASAALWWARIRGTRRYVDMHYDWPAIVVYVLVLLVQYCVLLISLPASVELLAESLLFTVLVWLSLGRAREVVSNLQVGRRT